MALSMGPTGVPVQAPIDQTADLWLKIDQYHLNYLKSDENTKKIDIRKKLESFIQQYMCLVSQDRKFCSSSTGEIILQSCRWVPDFSALTAARAFESIEKYAANLINQPWRKEFKEIKQYGGFFKHQVQKYLSGAETLFHQMGYMSTGHESMVLEGPVDQDRITTVARDCILAFVECQIIASVVQGVSAAHFHCSWEEAFIFRRDHIGTPEQAVRSLIYLKNQTHFQQGMQPNAMVPPGIQFYQRFPMSQQYPVPNGMTPGTYPPFAYQPQMGYYPNQAMTPQQIQGITANGISNGHVPTGKLVDISHEHQSRKMEEPKANGSGSSGSSTSTVTGRPGPIPLTIKHLEEENRRKSMAVVEGRQPTNNNSLETWDYVYRQLENIGYTKDQAERPDVLDFLSQMAQKRRQELQQQQQQQQPVPRQQPATPSWSDDPRQTSPEVGGTTSEDDSSRRYNSNSAPRPKPRQRRSEEEMDQRVDHRRSQHQQPQRPPSNNTASLGRPQANHRRVQESEDIHISETVSLPHRMSRHTKPLHPPGSPQPPKLPQKKRHLPQVPSGSTSLPRNWCCGSCTYKNRIGDEICAMCFKSRRYTTGDSESGGCTTDDYETTNGDDDLEDTSGADEVRNTIECSKCTLINQMANKVCDACGASLHISPIKDDDDDS